MYTAAFSFHAQIARRVHSREMNFPFPRRPTPVLTEDMASA